MLLSRRAPLFVWRIWPQMCSTGNKRQAKGDLLLRSPNCRVSGFGVYSSGNLKPCNADKALNQQTIEALGRGLCITCTAQTNNAEYSGSSPAAMPLCSEPVVEQV